MALSPQKFREIIFQLLYSYDFILGDEEDMIKFMMTELSVTKKTMKEAQEKHKKISLLIAEIDEHIRKFSISYDLERIGRVEKSILRLGVYELCYDDLLPSKVAIAEAIRLTRKFSTPESGSFINAVLDALLQDRLGVKDHDLVSTPSGL